MVGGRRTGAEGIIRLAGGRNAIDGFKGYKPLSPEAALVAARPSWWAGKTRSRNPPRPAGEGGPPAAIPSQCPIRVLADASATDCQQYWIELKAIVILNDCRLSHCLQYRQSGDAAVPSHRHGMLGGVTK
ncbi:hypothetical protein [Azospirillum agricola]|uniref:hypothetical protein n=1 Tax=Azospirillum agricola TaxID=1720247 RepID=UPI001177E72D|nr:hypothetical protein [Azospirillum agricola]